jgi:hypothetical protein
VISNEASFEHIETCGSLNVLRRRPNAR